MQIKIPEYKEWIHAAKGVPWRMGGEEWEALLRDGWEIVCFNDGMTLLRRYKYVEQNKK